MSRFTVVSAVSLLTIPAAAVAQDAAACPAGQVLVTTLGISQLRCDNCNLFLASDPRDSRWVFGSEPVVESAVNDASGTPLIRAGDVIVAVDGQLITTGEGGRRYSRPEAGRSTVLQIRRGDRDLSVALDPRTECRDTSARPGIVSGRAGVVSGRDSGPPLDSVRVARGRALLFPSGTRPVLESLMPAGRLGLSFQCSSCQVESDGDSVRVWTFSEPPVIVSVEADGPAGRAGLRRGDRIVSIGGLGLTTRAGGQRFGAVSPGQTVALGYDRAGRTGRAEFVAGSRSGIGVLGSRSGVGSGARSGAVTGRSAGGVSGAGASAGFEPLTAGVVRYMGQLGETMIEVTGEPIAVIQEENEIVIRSSTITVRIRRESGAR